MTKTKTTNLDIDTWLDQLANDPTVEAADARDLRDIGIALLGVQTADAALNAAISHARANGRSWTEIANILGVSRQAARQRFQSTTDTAAGALAELRSTHEELARKLGEFR